jgi:hypothetical protein
VKLADLLRVGRIVPGLITARYDGRSWEAEISHDGSIHFQSKPCSSLSEAGKAVKVASRGPDIPQSVAATDGWDFWSAVDVKQGDEVKLKEIGRRAAAIPGQQYSRTSH